MKKVIGGLLSLVLLLAIGSFFLNSTVFAPDAGGHPRLIATRPGSLPTDARGCLIEANLGSGVTQRSKADVQAWQVSVGQGADALLLPMVDRGGAAVLARPFALRCAADRARAPASPTDLVQQLPRPLLFLALDPRLAARAAPIAQTVAQSQAGALGRVRFLVPDAASAARLRAAVPGVRAYSWAEARACLSRYKLQGWVARVPEICRGRAALLGLGDLWMVAGWPNRFLERMRAADADVIIAASTVDGRPQGLTQPEQFGKIASSFDGFILVDDIASLGRALKR